MSYVEIETGRYVKRWAFWNPATWSIPKLYWDAWSQEQRLHAICRQLEKVIKYADYLGVNVDDIAARMKAIEEGQLDPVIEAAIEEWFEENEPEIAQAIASLNEALPIDDFNSENTVKSNLDRIDDDIDRIDDDIEDINTRLTAYNVITVEQYGAVGDGVTDCTEAIQRAIDENPYSNIFFRGGTYIISDTIFIDSDIYGTSIDLNGSVVKWNGANSSTYTEGAVPTLLPDHDGISSNPCVMFAVERRQIYDPTLIGGECVIKNGTLDGNYKAGICIQSVGFYANMASLAIKNFQYIGILIGTLDGCTYDAGVVTSTAGQSLQNRMTDCYFARGDDMSARNTSAVFVTFPDNNFVNLITNRTMHGMTMRIGGNSISNSHFTAQFETWPVIADFKKTSHIRIWPFNSGATQINVFENCYFNAAFYVFYTYRDETQSFVGASLRTVVGNCHYTFYRSSYWEEMIYPVWYGGKWYGLISSTQCALLYGDYANMLVYATDPTPNLRTKQNCEISFVPEIYPHEHCYLFDAANFNNREPMAISSSSAPIAAGTYKRVAAIVTRNPSGAANLIPGAISFELSGTTSVYHVKGWFIRNASGNGYKAVIETTDTYSMKMYVGETETVTKNDITYYVAYIYIYSPSAITESRTIKLEAEYQLNEIYVYNEPYSNDTLTSPNQNVFNSITGYEIF